MLTPFGKEMRKARIELEMRLSQLSLRSHIHPKTINLIEINKAKLHKNYPRILIEALDAPPELEQLLHIKAAQTYGVLEISVPDNDLAQQAAGLLATRFRYWDEARYKTLLNQLTKIDDEEELFE
ncbi:hypothetical protein [Celerinatantimonas sp. MCCC 1A17872]|uniref:hypothetical protein n=1 Tax=Celerinatantimonas sp. MCCC 1A17872 TaxID=3177514 RepID=UPI0038C81A8A